MRLPTVPSHSRSKSGDGEVLAWGSANKDVWPGEGARAFREVIGGHVSKVDRIGLARRKHGRREFLNLRAPRPAPVRHGRLRRADAAEKGSSGKCVAAREHRYSLPLASVCINSTSTRARLSAA